MNFLRVQRPSAQNRLATAGGAQLEADVGAATFPDAEFDLGLRPEHLSVEKRPDAWQRAARCEGRVAFREALGSETLVHVDLGGDVTWVAAIRERAPHDLRRPAC